MARATRTLTGCAGGVTSADRSVTADPCPSRSSATTPPLTAEIAATTPTIRTLRTTERHPFRRLDVSE